MTWPLPTPDQLSERMAAGLIAQFPEADLDPRAPDTMVGVLARLWGMGLFETHLYLRYLAEQVMVDTATEFLPRHAAIWGLTRIDAAAAAGAVTFTGTTGTVVPAGVELRSSTGQIYATQAPATLVDGAATADVVAQVAGAAGNAATGAVLTLVTGIAGLTPQSATVTAGGLTGGADAEGDEALRARVLARIRQPSMGGARADYEAWARLGSAEIQQVAVLPAHVGPGTVGVVVAMTGPRAPTEPEVAAIAAAIEEQRPVTASVTVLPATLGGVPFSIRLTPDTVAVRSAVTAALTAFFQRESTIGGTIPRSRLSEAISSAAGEFAHEMTVPAADVTAAPTQLRTRGAITWLPPA